MATPGRALDHISRGTLDLSKVKHVVLDEGDTMLEMGFAKDVESIVSNVKKPGEKSRKMASSALERMDDAFGVGQIEIGDDLDDDDDVFPDFDDEELGLPAKARSPSNGRDVQMLLFSATMPGWICKLTDKHMVNPVFLDAVQEGETRLADTIKHVAIRLPPTNDRMEAVMALLGDVILTKGRGGQTIVFTNKKEDADNLFASQCFGQLRTQILHGDISQNTRQNTLKAFKKGQVDVLIATDVAARGIDIAGVDLVVHTCLPMDPDTYVHRSGRTGRAGRNGTSVLFLGDGEERKLPMFENTLQFRFGRAGAPTAREVSDASAAHATIKVDTIQEEVVNHFLPHARALMEKAARKARQSSAGALLDVDDLEGEEIAVVEEVEDDVDDGPVEYTPELVEDVLARCLAAICNRNSIVSR